MEKEDIPWYTGLSILIFLIPIAIFRLTGPLYVILGHNEGNVRGNPWTLAILIGFVFTLAVIMFSMLEKRFLQEVAFSTIKKRSRDTLFIMLTIYYIVIITSLWVMGETQAIIGAFITLGMLMLVIYVFIGALSDQDLEIVDSYSTQ